MPPRPAGVEMATMVSGSKVTALIMLADGPPDDRRVTGKHP
jgi:hypothetical protein